MGKDQLYAEAPAQNACDSEAMFAQCADWKDDEQGGGREMSLLADFD